MWMFSFKLLIFATLLALWQSVYYKLMFSLFCLDAYEHYDHFMKIMTNQKSHHERSLLRNLVFNLIRCMANELFRHYVMEMPFADEVIITRVALVIGMTVFVQVWLPKNKIEASAELWSFLFTAFGITFGLFWLNDLTQAEVWS